MKKLDSMTILAGDIGGTQARLGLFSVINGRYRLLLEKNFQSQDYKGLEIIAKEFLQGQKKIASACFGVAGPVIEGRVKTTNLPWRIHAASLKKELGIRTVGLINDLVANGYGIPLLKKKDFEALSVGKERKGNAALVSAGTGLGEAVLFRNGREHVPSPSEGGHIDFGPRNSLEIDLHRYLMDRYGHVSYERIVSGAGLFHLYQFLRDAKKFGKEPAWLLKRMKEKDPAALISEMARQRKNRLCVMALDMFASI